MIYNKCILMESLDTSSSNSLMPVRQMFNLPPPHSPHPPLALMMIKSLLLEEKGGDVEAFKVTAAL